MCPPGTDQTTRSRPQWNLLAPELEQRQALPEKYKSPDNRFWRRDRRALEYFLTDGLSWGAFEKLARIKPCDTNAQPVLLPTWVGRPATTSSALESLPAELLGMVTSELPVPDKVSLGLCSQGLWYRFLRELQAAYRANAAPWAGKAIICTSTWLTDLPPAIHDLYPELRKGNEEWLAGGHARGRRFGMPPARRWNWDTYEFMEAKGSDLEQDYIDALKQHARSDGFVEKLQAALESMVKKESLCSTPHNGTWVLRNLNNREVVRFERTRSEGKEDVHLAVKDFPWLTLDFLLTMQISWAGELGANSIRDGDLTSDDVESPLSTLKYGVWAGHRFDLIEAGDLDSEEEWRDSTDEVAKKADAIRRCLPPPEDPE